MEGDPPYGPSVDAALACRDTNCITNWDDVNSKIACYHIGMDSIAIIKNRHMGRAHAAVVKALRKGQLIRPSACSCGRKFPSAHHDDYLKPLEVEWVCPKCHSALHRYGEIDLCANLPHVEIPRAAAIASRLGIDLSVAVSCMTRRAKVSPTRPQP